MYIMDSLNQKLVAAREAYYAGTPLMSDAEYDVLEAQLAGLNRKQPDGTPAPSVLTTVGTDTAGRIPHAHPMRSIENKYTFDEVVSWAAALGWPKLSLSGKFDGISCSLTYENGQLVKAVTRGDGDAGESILAQVSVSPYIPHHLPVPITIEIRGELVIHRSHMLKLNEALVAAGGKPYVSTRNLVAGTVKLKDLEEVKKREMRFMPWEVLAPLLDNPESGSDSAALRICDLGVFGFVAPGSELVEDEASLRTGLEKSAAVLTMDNPEIGMDGIVIKVDSCAQRRELGYGSKFANFQVAYKAQNARTESVLKEVIWQVGRQGRLTPVGVIDPVVLAGATIERVTLNNLSWIRSMGLKIGSSVVVVRSGDVIPQIVEVLDGE
jgi:DNA ligase (NAD+)